MVVVWGALATVKAADFTVISQPDILYKSGSNLIQIGSIGDGTTLSSITDSNQTVNFSDTLTKGTVPGGGWANWGSPPNTESSTPPVLITSASVTSLTLNLLIPSTTFGFELESGNGSAYTISVDFKQGSSVIGNISLTVNSNAGAQLFAAKTILNPFTSLVINAPAGAQGFAMAQFRYSTNVPEPSTYAMAAATCGVFGLYGCRKRLKSNRPA
jgi:hypothetical protein